MTSTSVFLQTRFWPIPIRIPVTILLFAGTCASGIFWGDHFFAPNPVIRPAPAYPVNVRSNAPDAKSLFGWQSGMAVETGSFQLKGLLVAGKSENSVAVLAVDGRPAGTFRVGTPIAAGVSLAEIHPHYVVIIEAGMTRRIELPSGASGNPGNQDPKTFGLLEHGDLESGNATHENTAREPEGNKSYPLNAQNPFFGRIRHSAAAG